MSEFLKRTWAEIHLDRLQGNFQAIQASLAPGSQAMAVVKADGYGHGAAAAAKGILPHDLRGLPPHLRAASAKSQGDL